MTNQEVGRTNEARTTPPQWVTRARRSYVAGGIGFIFIGAMHTAVHVLELSGADLEGRFRTLGTIPVSGQTPESWDLFQGTSLLMGLFSMAIGLIDLGALRAIDRNDLPPTIIGLTNMVVLAGIIGIGARHLGPLQIYGGLLGLCLFGVGVAANLATNPGARQPTPIH